MTTYIILRKNDAEPDGNTPILEWKEVAVAEASSGRRALAAANVGTGTYLPVPSRSWKPLTVTVEQTTKVTIG